jgi:photosystem II stability/assembly factor-like uncharacterized protein
MIRRTLAALLGLVALTLLAGCLPEAPVPPATINLAPNTTHGTLGRQLMTAAVTSGTTLWAVMPTGGFWALIRSTDAGHVWHDVTPVGDSTEGGLVLAALSPSTAVVAFRAYVLNSQSAFAVTTNGGAAWATGTLPGAVADGQRSLALSRNRIWAVLTGGRLVSSADGGSHWSASSISSGSCHVTSVAFASPVDGEAGLSCASSAALAVTTDQGLRWKVVSTPSPSRTQTLPAITPGGPALAVSAAAVDVTDDAGVWTRAVSGATTAASTGTGCWAAVTAAQPWTALGTSGGWTGNGRPATQVSCAGGSVGVLTDRVLADGLQTPELVLHAAGTTRIVRFTVPPPPSQ